VVVVSEQMKKQVYIPTTVDRLSVVTAVRGDVCRNNFANKADKHCSALKQAFEVYRYAASEANECRGGAEDQLIPRADFAQQ
jgi:hypothetical protein